MQGDREKSIAAGATDYVTKPIDIEELLTRMEQWLASARHPASGLEPAVIRDLWLRGPGRGTATG